MLLSQILISSLLIVSGLAAPAKMAVREPESMDKMASEIMRREIDDYWGHDVNKREDDDYWGHANKRSELKKNCAQNAKGTVFCAWSADEVTAHGATEEALKSNCFQHSEGGVVCAYHMA